MLPVLLFIIGLGTLSYPTVSNLYNKMMGSRAVGGYNTLVSATSEEEIKAIYSNAKDYNERLLNNPQTLINGKSENEDYLSQLKISENTQIIGSVEIPSIGVNLSIYHGTDEPVLQRAVGHLEGSSLPIGGESTHTVLTGHTGLPSAKLFTDINKLVLGDKIIIKVLNQTMIYEVFDMEVVLPEEVDSLLIQKYRDLATLVTCTPYGVNSHRLLVHANRIDEIEYEMDNSIGNEALMADYIIISSVAAALIIFIVSAIFIFRRSRM